MRMGSGQMIAAHHSGESSGKLQTARAAKDMRRRNDTSEHLHAIWMFPGSIRRARQAGSSVEVLQQLELPRVVSVGAGVTCSPSDSLALGSHAACALPMRAVCSCDRHGDRSVCRRRADAMKDDECSARWSVEMHNINTAQNPFTSTAALPAGVYGAARKSMHRHLPSPTNPLGIAQPLCKSNALVHGAMSSPVLQ